MVEIIPYVEDNEDQFTWIPLAHQGSGSDTATNDGPSASKPAAEPAYAKPRSEGAAAAAAGTGSTNTNSEANTNTSTSNSSRDELLHSRHRVSSTSHDDIVIVENVQDGEDINNDVDDDKWQQLSAESLSKPEERRRRDDDASTPALLQPWLWGNQLIAHITSPIHTKISDPTTSTASVVNVARGGGEDDTIVWRRPDELDDIVVDGENQRRLHGRKSRQRNYVEEEYDDGKIISTIHSPTPDAANTAQNQQSSVRSESLPWAEDEDTQGNDQRWERPSQQNTTSSRQSNTNQRRNRDYDATPCNDNPSSSSSSTVKSKLHQTLIHDPLRSLPFCFIRHFYNEMKYQITCTWETYREQNELHTILAPLTLVSLVTLWGMALIATGCTVLVTFVVRSLVQMIWSLYIWLMEYSWRMANRLVWFSICASLFMGTIVWVGMRVSRNQKKDTNNAKHQSLPMPSVSAIITWIIAITSPSLVEAIAILLSLQIFASIFAHEENDMECLASDGSDHDPFCATVDVGLNQSTKSSYYDMSHVAIVSVALTVALMNIVVVSIAANMLEQHSDQSKIDISNDEMNDAKNALAVEPNDSSSTLARLRVHYNRIRRNIGACYTISILSLVCLTITLVLIQTLYIYFRTKGSSVIISLINRIGLVGINILCIGVGVFTLFHTWNFTINKVTDTNNFLGNGLSCGEISRLALKKSIVEISSNAVWSKEDTGSSLLGILSDDDGALRYAIFEWIVDRWTSSPTPSDQSSPHAADDMDDNVGKENTGTNNPQFSNESSSTSTTNVGTSSNHQSLLPSYQSLQSVIAKLDADETLIPSIERYREWVYSLPPSQNAAMCVAIWKLCPAATILSLSFLCCVGRSALGKLAATFFWFFGVLFTSTANQDGGCMIFIFGFCTILSPSIFLEYCRVQMWWACITSYMNRMDSERRSSDAKRKIDLTMTLLKADRSINASVLPDTSDLFLRIWALLLESISVLESSVPVVRCATIASAAVDLTTNTMCLVDLALEVKKRGILCGVGILIWDAFTYHLSQEIEQRKQETVGEDQANEMHTPGRDEFGGKYTGAVVSSVENIGKLSRNIGGLMDHKSVSDKTKGGASEDGIENTKSKETEQPSSVNEEKEEIGGSNNVSHQSDYPTDKPLELISFGNETQNNPSLKDEVDKNENGLLPIWIGGGLAIAGAVAGLAVHAAAANKGNHKRKDAG